MLFLLALCNDISQREPKPPLLRSLSSALGFFFSVFAPIANEDVRACSQPGLCVHRHTQCGFAPPSAPPSSLLHPVTAPGRLSSHWACCVLLNFHFNTVLFPECLVLPPHSAPSRSLLSFYSYISFTFLP